MPDDKIYRTVRKRKRKLQDSNMEPKPMTGKQNSLFSPSHYTPQNRPKALIIQISKQRCLSSVSHEQWPQAPLVFGEKYSDWNCTSLPGGRDVAPGKITVMICVLLNRSRWWNVFYVASTDANHFQIAHTIADIPNFKLKAWSKWINVCKSLHGH